ncbi:hypothetical protein CROQUDRAFT_671256 [Cronartium quercuum f. sp. fusiforme G11]|uniref:Uncharacterized protein n=1 Tax=Cronartium quercuum f. sp. fusiforme G11 TaxID=708437 RepID=A0A9P6TC15_9BASI|nr:hypothetical protein CROQUDRAFT_671256 [Cronartium quercuum f. sp. fusiforme G11]
MTFSTSALAHPPLRHPLPPRPCSKTPKQNENENTKPRSRRTPIKRRPLRPMNAPDSNRPVPVTSLAPLDLGLPPKPLAPFPPPASRHGPSTRQSGKVHHPQTHQTRQGSIRSLSSSSTLLSPTTREDARLRRESEEALESTPTTAGPPSEDPHPAPTPNLERELAIARVRRAATDAAARKTTAVTRPHYTPKPLLLPSKLARAGTTQKRNTIRSQTLDQLTGTCSIPLAVLSRPTQHVGDENSDQNGAPQTRRKASEAAIFGHRRIFTDTPRSANIIPLANSSRSLHRLTMDSPRVLAWSPRSVNRMRFESPTRGSGTSDSRRRSVDGARSRYDSFYQLLGPEQSAPVSAEAEYYFDNYLHDPDHRPSTMSDSPAPVLLSPLSISPPSARNHARRISRAKNHSALGLSGAFARPNENSDLSLRHRQSVFDLSFLSHSNSEPRHTLRTCRSDSALLTTPKAEVRIDGAAVFVSSRAGAAVGRLKTILEEAEPEPGLLDRIARWWQ